MYTCVRVINIVIEKKSVQETCIVFLYVVEDVCITFQNIIKNLKILQIILLYYI